MSSQTIFKNRYNAAAWKDVRSGHTVVMARQVEQGAEEGAPDRGKLVVLTINKKNQLVSEEIAWQPSDDRQHLEDPRATVTENGEVVIGMTAVVKEDDKFVPFPALASWKSDRKLNEVTVIDKFGPGKNLTPFDKNNWVFRREDDNHRLLILKVDEKNIESTGELVFPHPPIWASYRMGTTVPPIWVTPQQALMLIHGIRYEKGIYHYSIGRAKITKSADIYKVAWVDTEPLITPLDFVDEGKSMYGELHDFRRVVYVCGGVIKRVNLREKLILYVNVGDKQTVELPIPLEALLQGFTISEKIPLPAILMRVIDNEETKSLKLLYQKAVSGTAKVLGEVKLPKLNDKIKIKWNIFRGDK